MTTLRVRLVKAKLKTAADGGDAWQEAFLGGSSAEGLCLRQVDIDVAQEALGVPLLGSAINVAHHTTGEFSDDIDSPAHDFGLIGEMLAWRYYRARRLDAVRVPYAVVETASGNWKRVQKKAPDFVVREPRAASGTRIRLIEVKSGDALSIRRLGEGEPKPPCHRARERVRDGLGQLGLTTNLESDGSSGYHLKLRNGAEPVPFPGDVGTVVACLFVDGRLERPVHNRRLSGMVGTGRCAKASTIRKCSECVTDAGGRFDVLAARLNNAPGLMQLHGSGERGDLWFDAFQAWARAVRLRHPHRSQRAAARLKRELQFWAEQGRVAPGSEVLEWWVRLLTTHQPEVLASIESLVTAAEPRRLPPGLLEWDGQSTLLDADSPIDAMRWFGQVGEDFNPGGAGLAGAGFSLTTMEGVLDLRIDLAGSQRRPEVNGTADAEVLAAHALTFLLWHAERDAVSKVAMARSSVRGGSRRRPVALGWRSAGMLDAGYRAWGSVALQPYWYRALRYGVGGARVVVLPDGWVRVVAPLEPHSRRVSL